MKKHRVAPEVKEQIINRIKNEGVSIAQAATEHGIHETTIYKWLGSKADGTPSVLEFGKVKRERDELLRLVGEITLKLSETQKRGEGVHSSAKSGTSPHSRHCTLHSLLPQAQTIG